MLSQMFLLQQSDRRVKALYLGEIISSLLIWALVFLESYQSYSQGVQIYPIQT